MQHDSRNDIDAAVVFVKFGNRKRKGGNRDEIVLRLLDEKKNRKKMLTLRISRQNGRISIQDSTVTSSFFFEDNRNQNMVSTDRIDIMNEMESDYVGFWIMYRYRKVNLVYMSI